jgi:ATP/maltotriose-dependent transcriptional regulator MalT
VSRDPLVLPTKLRPPHVREGLIERPDLVERLREGRDRALTLVCAPAGYGKTILLAQWQTLDREDTPFVWIALDERDMIWYKYFLDILNLMVFNHNFIQWLCRDYHISCEIILKFCVVIFKHYI